MRNCVCVIIPSILDATTAVVYMRHTFPLGIIPVLGESQAGLGGQVKTQGEW